jgi:Domain of unknown function (DUF1707)
MDDRIRISDADRDRVTARLNHHFAEGRLTREELDERVTAALNATTHADLRRVMADLPEPAAPPGAEQPPHARPFPPYGPPPWGFRRRRPRILPLVLIVLLAALLLPTGGWLIVGFLKVVLLFWLIALLGAIFVAARFRRRMRRHWRSGGRGYWGYGGPGGPRGGYGPPWRHHSRW